MTPSFAVSLLSGANFCYFRKLIARKFLLAIAKKLIFQARRHNKTWCNFVAKQDKRRLGECKKVQLEKRSKSAPREASNLTYLTSYTKSDDDASVKA